ncbi:MAG: NAD(+) synthase [Clostridia bacterium]|nr:NAD(+) synthase [Clostridia bacterium]
MRDYKIETEKRVAFIKKAMADAHADGIVFGNSGGKDSALVGILCKMACDNVLGVIMPCQSKRNFGEDMDDGIDVATQFNIETITVDLTSVKEEMVKQIESVTGTTDTAKSNIAPRLRMTTLYTIAQSRNAMVAGTGNKCELYMGYFTKWGDGGCDINPIADLTVSEIYEFLTYLNAPENIIKKAPSAGLFEGQTDEQEMGVTYKQIEEVMATGTTDDKAAAEKIIRTNQRTEHKRRMPLWYAE